MHGIKGAIFDMDGLMLDTEKLFMRFWKQAAADYGYEMTTEHILDSRSLASKYSRPKFKAIFGDEFPFDEIRARRLRIMAEYIDEHGFEVKKGLFELIDYLKNNGYKIAVATATDRQRTNKYLGMIGALERFDAVICGDMVKNGKPDPDIYLRAADELNLNPEECAAFEDSPNGLRSAYAAGCKVIMIPDLSQPDGDIMPLLSAVYESLDKAIDFFEGEAVE